MTCRSVSCHNKQQSNLAISEIASFLLYALPVGFDPQISPSPGGHWDSDTYLTQCVVELRKCIYQIASTSVERFKQGARGMTDDRRQTDRQNATVECVAIGGIACAGAIPPNNYGQAQICCRNRKSAANSQQVVQQRRNTNIRHLDM